MKKLLNILFLSCLKASELVEKKLQFKLSFKEKLQLKGHMMMCDACTIYEKQSTIIDKVLSKKDKKEDVNPDMEKLKQSIKEKIKDIKK